MIEKLNIWSNHCSELNAWRLSWPLKSCYEFFASHIYVTNTPMLFLRLPNYLKVNGSCSQKGAVMWCACTSNVAFGVVSALIWACCLSWAPSLYDGRCPYVMWSSASSRAWCRSRYWSRGFGFFSILSGLARGWVGGGGVLSHKAVAVHFICPTRTLWCIVVCLVSGAQTAVVF